MHAHRGINDLSRDGVEFLLRTGEFRHARRWVVRVIRASLALKGTTFAQRSAECSRRCEEGWRKGAFRFLSAPPPRTSASTPRSSARCFSASIRANFSTPAQTPGATPVKHVTPFAILGLSLIASTSIGKQQKEDLYSIPA